MGREAFHGHLVFTTLVLVVTVHGQTVQHILHQWRGQLQERQRGVAAAGGTGGAAVQPGLYACFAEDVVAGAHARLEQHTVANST